MNKQVSLRNRNWSTATAKNRSIGEISRQFARNTALDLRWLLSAKQPEPALRCLLFHTVFDDQKEHFKSIKNWKRVFCGTNWY